MPFSRSKKPSRIVNTSLNGSLTQLRLRERNQQLEDENRKLRNLARVGNDDDRDRNVEVEFRRRLRSATGDLKSEVKCLQAQLQRNDAEKEDLEVRISQLQEELSVLKNQQASANILSEDMAKGNIRRSREEYKKVQDLEKNVKGLKETLESKDQDLLKAQKKFEKEKNKRTNLNTRVMELEKEIEKLDIKYRNLKAATRKSSWRCF